MFELVVQQIPADFWDIRVTDLISVLLTFGLFIVYWKMKNIQDEQNTIQRQQNRLMSRQTDIMSVNHRPILSREAIRVNGDELTLEISNSGNGPAANLHLQCVVYEQKSAEDGEPIFGRGYKREGTAVVPKWNVLTRETVDARKSPYNINTVSASQIEEGETNVSFDGEISLDLLAMGTSKYEVPFSEAMQRINREWDTEKVAIEFWLSGIDVTDNPVGYWFGSFVDIQLKKDLELEEAIRFGEEGARIGDPVNEDEGASMMILDGDDIQF